MNKFNSNQEKIFLDSSLVQLANLIPGYVFWKDLEGRFLGSNEAHLKALGLNKIDQLVGKDDFDFYPKDVAETCRKYDKMATSEKQVIKLGEEVRNKSGFEEIWVTSKAPLYNAEGEIIGVIGVSLDITASKKNEMLEKKQKLEQEKIEKEKALLETALMQKTLEEKKLLSKLAAQVAHDVRSPLSALMIVTENDLSNVPEHTRILVRDAISQIRDIINNLDPKAFQKEKALTQIAVLIDLILSERRVAFKDKNVLIECQFSTEAYHLFVETIPTEMKRVITNLINNAVDALSPDKQGRVTILLERENERAVIRVQDNGMGMPVALLKSILDNPTTTKEKGSGLGLSHAKKTIEQFEGRIELHSTQGVGTTVSLFMPVYSPPFWFLEKLVIQTGDHIICVDDSISIWNLWQERFKPFKDNLQLEYCSNKQMLLQLLGKETLDCRIYLVDYGFSGQKYNGIDLIKRILNYKKPIDQVFLVTSRFDEKDVVEFCQEESIKIIPKFYAGMIKIEKGDASNQRDFRQYQ